MKNWSAITIDNYHLEQKNSIAINNATLNGSPIFALVSYVHGRRCWFYCKNSLSSAFKQHGVK